MSKILLYKNYILYYKLFNLGVRIKYKNIFVLYILLFLLIMCHIVYIFKINIIIYFASDILTFLYITYVIVGLLILKKV